MELTYFFMQGCPYCRRADKYLAELVRENPEFSAVKIHAIDERAQKQLADSYDYFYVPCFFLGNEKLHEGAADKQQIQAVLERALRG